MRTQLKPFRVCALGMLLTAACMSGPVYADTDVQALVEAQAFEIVKDVVASPDRFEVQSIRFGGADPVPQGHMVLELDEVSGPNASGIVQLQFRMLVDGTPRGRARASARGIVRGPAVVARETLRGGEIVESTSVEVEEADLTRVSGAILRNATEVAGLVPIRSLGTGRVLTTDLMRPQPVVRRGDTINLTVRRGTLIVTAQGVARKDGAPGEQIPAVNSRSGVELIGLVQADGSVQVVQAAQARRVR